MFTSSLARRGGARLTAATALVALTVAGTALAGAPAAFAAPVPGDNGTVKIHTPDTDPGDPKDEPKVCEFYLDATGFDAMQNVHWSIETQPHVNGGDTASGDLVADANGAAHTDNVPLDNGQYKLTWTFTGENGAGKMKVFKVDCTGSSPSPTPTPTPTPTSTHPGGPGGPHGGPPAGGGGLARTEDFSPVAGAAAAGLVVVGGVVYFRLRRRPDGAA